MPQSKRGWGDIDLLLSVRPIIFNFVTKVEKWGHQCPMDLSLFSFFYILLQ